ncbi:predicted protein [Naegleria gruberi]|uniref:Predicted protein n=1 Tax=Naegleria gruberi TaxID=5762 RepID=D2VF60_NAEGR|nr:uncharacterized protein NAEGRDRAFT_67511 [Naegleria gruberi]EFC44718.1 predicted protein [Naegleria gruberi]|eukprot:XP_002677462.1 predicted protein [Naegleria gruberi strain NEG-M]
MSQDTDHNHGNVVLMDKVEDSVASHVSNDDQSSIVDSSDLLESSQTLSDQMDDIISTASSVFSTYHSRIRKKERLFSNELIKKIKKFGCYGKERVSNNSLEIRWKVEYEGNVIILSEDFKTLITCYREENPAIPFYNDLCDRFDTCGKFFTKYETKLTLEEFKNEINGKKTFYSMNFEIWPMNKPILLQTARNGRLDLLRYLIEECNYNPFIVGKGKYSILHYACYDGRFEMLEYLIKNKNLRKLFEMKDQNGESGFDALVNSKKITNESVRKKCIQLFDLLNDENDNEKVSSKVSNFENNEKIEKVQQDSAKLDAIESISDKIANHLNLNN